AAQPPRGKTSPQRPQDPASHRRGRHRPGGRPRPRGRSAQQADQGHRALHARRLHRHRHPHRDGKARPAPEADHHCREPPRRQQQRGRVGGRQGRSRRLHLPVDPARLHHQLPSLQAGLQARGPDAGGADGRPATVPVRVAGPARQQRGRAGGIRPQAPGQAHQHVQRPRPQPPPDRARASAAPPEHHDG
ncbi:hypothetical protein OY671_009906, partial [Metschnikowia pulcherrima]